MFEQANVWETICEYLRNRITWPDVTFREEWNTVSIPKLLVMVDLAPTGEKALTLENFGSEGYFLAAYLNFNVSVWGNFMKYGGTSEERITAKRDVLVLRDKVTALFKENNQNFILLNLKEFINENEEFSSNGIDTGRKIKIEPNGDWVRVPEADKNFLHYSRFYQASWKSQF